MSFLKLRNDNFYNDIVKIIGLKGHNQKQEFNILFDIFFFYFTSFILDYFFKNTSFYRFTISSCCLDYFQTSERFELLLFGILQYTYDDKVEYISYGFYESENIPIGGIRE